MPVVPILEQKDRWNKSLIVIKFLSLDSLNFHYNTDVLSQMMIVTGGYDAFYQATPSTEVATIIFFSPFPGLQLLSKSLTNRCSTTASREENGDRWHFFHF